MTLQEFVSDTLIQIVNGVEDARGSNEKMTPTGENPLERLNRSQIASIALRAGAIGRDLSAIIESIPNKK